MAARAWHSGFNRAARVVRGSLNHPWRAARHPWRCGGDEKGPRGRGLRASTEPRLACREGGGSPWHAAKVVQDNLNHPWRAAKVFLDNVSNPWRAVVNNPWRAAKVVQALACREGGSGLHIWGGPLGDLSTQSRRPFTFPLSHRSTSFHFRILLARLVFDRDSNGVAIWSPIDSVVWRS